MYRPMSRLKKVNEPNYHVTASLLVTLRGVGLNFRRPWGVRLHNAEPGDLNQNILFLSVNIMGEACCFFLQICGEAMTTRRPGHLTHKRGISGASFHLPSLRPFFRDLEALIVKCVFLFAIPENKT